MAYIMWKNVGRESDEHGHNLKFCLKNIFLGPVVGILLVVAGLATFILYEMAMTIDNVDKADSKDRAIMMHFVMNIVIVSLMSFATVLGCGVFKMDQREHVSAKNPTRSLDVGLLVGASLGQFMISYFSIVAMVATGAKGLLNALNLAWAIMMVIQLALQNFFILEGLHREPHHDMDPVTIVANPYVKQSDKEGTLEGPEMDKKMSPLPADLILHEHNAENKHKLSWKRRVAKEVCAFLLLGNIIVSAIYYPSK